MRSLGIYEAKARLSEICDEVVRSGEAVVITRRGRPLVRIEPVGAERFSVWEDRAEYEARQGPFDEEFEPPPRNPEIPRSPLDD